MQHCLAASWGCQCGRTGPLPEHKAIPPDPSCRLRGRARAAARLRAHTPSHARRRPGRRVLRKAVQVRARGWVEAGRAPHRCAAAAAARPAAASRAAPARSAASAPRSASSARRASRWRCSGRCRPDAPRPAERASAWRASARACAAPRGVKAWCAPSLRRQRTGASMPFTGAARARRDAAPARADTQAERHMHHSFWGEHGPCLRKHRARSWIMVAWAEEAGVAAKGPRRVHDELAST